MATLKLGKHLNARQRGALRKRLAQALDDAGDTLRLDLRELTLLDSQGAALLFALAHAARQRAVSLHFDHVPAEHAQRLRVLGLAELASIRTAEEGA